MDKSLKIAIGTEAFPPTIDGISTVAKCYADVINEKYGKSGYSNSKKPNQEDYKYPYEIYRYDSLFTFGEGYPVGWPFKKQFALDIIAKNFDILHSHCPIATSYFYRRINRIHRIPQILTYHTKYEYDIEGRVPIWAIRHRAYGFLLNNTNRQTKFGLQATVPLTVCVKSATKATTLLCQTVVICLNLTPQLI